MLISLSVQNYALIRELEIDFRKGLTIITGETGAGKSIILGAMSLILGQRADTSVLQDAEKKCIVEGIFGLKEYELKPFFEAELEGVDYNDNTVIRRVINPNGTSRAFINDIPVTLIQLKSLGSKLIDIHSQHQNLLLDDFAFQLRVVDAIASNREIVEAYQKVYAEWQGLKSLYARTLEQAKRQQEEIDFRRHQYEELAEARLRAGEQEELEAELQLLSHSAEIKAALSEAARLLSGGEPNLIDMLTKVRDALSRATAFYPKIHEFATRAESTYIELKDLAVEVEVRAGDIEYDPERADYISQRLDLLYSLEKKNKASGLDDLIALCEQLKTQIDDFSNLDERLESMSKNLKIKEQEVLKQASLITQSRKAVLPEIEESVSKDLQQLGMPNAVFKISLTLASEPGSTGADRIAFLFSANKNVAPEEIGKIASGGEISRLMLTIKALSCASMALPTIIFDEIDTGVSGDIADKMGNIMRRMARSMQVISITHLPQVASKADNHYQVFKDDQGIQTTTNIRELDQQGRIETIARMLSGENLTEAALSNARVLLGI